MKTTLLFKSTAIILLLTSNLNFGQSQNAGTANVYNTPANQSLTAQPVAPELATTTCYAIFTSNGAVTNDGVSFAAGDIGTNAGVASNYDSTHVTGTIHAAPDSSTAQAALDLAVIYDHLNTMPYNTELTDTANFGNSMILTPGTYLLNSNTILSGTLYFDAQGHDEAVFVVKVSGSLYAAINSKIVLQNGAKTNHIYWKIENGIIVDDFSDFSGSIICKEGAIDLRKQVILDGRAFTMDGNINTREAVVIMPEGCSLLATNSFTETTNQIDVYPNPFNQFITIQVNSISQIESAELSLFDVFGREVKRSPITKQATSIETSSLASGMYLYRVTEGGKNIQSGKLIAQ